MILLAAGLKGGHNDIKRELCVFVLDPTYIGFKMAESTAELELHHSKTGLFSFPPVKNLRNFGLHDMKSRSIGRQLLF